MLVKFVALLVGIPLLAFSFVLTISIVKIGWDIINGKKPPD